MHEIIAFFSILILFFVAMGILALKRWLYSWEGILVEKIIEQENGSNTNFSDYSPTYVQSFVLVFKTNSGKIIKREVDKERFSNAHIGDRYVKFRKSWDFKKHNIVNSGGPGGSFFEK